MHLSQLNGSNFIFLVLYVDDILLASSDIQLMHTLKTMLTKSFETKDLGQAHFVLGIEIKRKKQEDAWTSLKAYIDKAIKRFKMAKCSNGELPIGKDDKLNNDQSSKNGLEMLSMKDKVFVSFLGSLMHAQDQFCHLQ